MNVIFYDNDKVHSPLVEALNSRSYYMRINTQGIQYGMEMGHSCSFTRGSDVKNSIRAVVGQFAICSDLHSDKHCIVLMSLF